MAISLSKAIQGFNLHLGAEGVSLHTLRDYNLTLSRFVEFVGPMTVVDTITPDRVRQFLAYWQGREVLPEGVARRPPRILKPKTILNMHTALSSFWSWLVMEGFAEEHILKGRVSRPRVNPPAIEPLTDEQITRLIGTVNGSDRNRAILLFLIDTGARASEVCGLTVGDIDLQTRTAVVIGKGNKPRTVVFGDKTGKALFRYHAHRGDDRPSDPAFQNMGDKALSRSALYRIVKRAGDRAGIRGLHPHRLRHTFAIHYLRNGGDIYTLQHQLGHSDLSMVRRYLKIAGADVRRVHRLASPVENVLK